MKLKKARTNAMNHKSQKSAQLQRSFSLIDYVSSLSPRTFLTTTMSGSREKGRVANTLLHRLAEDQLASQKPRFTKSFQLVCEIDVLDALY